MSKRTMGQVEWEARMAFYTAKGFHQDFKSAWSDLSPDQQGAMEAGANAVLEEAAKVAEQIAAEADKACGVEFDRARRWHLADRRNLAKEFAEAIRSLKSTRDDLCQAPAGAKGEDGVAPEGALQAGLGEDA